MDAREVIEFRDNLFSRDMTVISNSKVFPEGVFTRDKYSSSMSDNTSFKSGLGGVQDVNLSYSVI